MLGSGCSGPPPHEPPPTVEHWSLQPAGVIGEVEPVDPVYAFEVISDARLLEGGAVAVADGRKVVKVFDAAGSFLASFGRIGDGPEELRFLDRLFRASDSSLVVVDSGRNRLLTFSNAGTFLAARALGPLRFDQMVVAEGGTVFGTTRWSDAFDTESMVTDRYRSDLVRVAGSGRTEIVRESRGPLVSGKAGFYDRTPLGAAAAVAPWGRGVAHTPGDRAVVHFFDQRGREVDSVVTSRVPRVVTDAVRQRWIEGRRALLGARGVDDPRAIFPLGEEPEWPSHLPIYTRLVAHGGGCLWAEVFSLPGEAREFDVLRPGVGQVATVVAGPELFLLDVARARAVSLARDELGVQTVALWTISGASDPATVCG